MAENDMTNAQWLELINKEWNNGNIVIMTIDGTLTGNAEKFIQQPVEGILYDLNRDKATLATLAEKSKNLRFINDFAVANTIITIKKYLDDAIEKTNELKTLLEIERNKVTELTEQLNSNKNTIEELTEENKQLKLENRNTKDLTESISTEEVKETVIPKYVDNDMKKRTNPEKKVNANEFVEGFNTCFELKL